MLRHPHHLGLSVHHQIELLIALGVLITLALVIRLVIGNPRAGKSGWLADRVIDHPGAAVTTTTRTDLYQNTSGLRGRLGVLHVFNPEGIGGLASTFRWDPVAGCQQPAVALQRAASFTAAT